jgi:general secretion pathway protein A
MYEQFFGFAVRPFALTPDPAFLYRSRQHGMALTILEYGIQAQAPLLLLTGEIGSGKTTLVRRFVRELDDRLTIGLISNTHTRTRSLLAWVLSALEIAPADDSDVAAYEAIADSCIRDYARGRRTLLIVDEAQNLGPDVVEELRLLSNINSEQDLVLQIMLVGQPELRAMLAQPSMRQIAQRVAADYHLRSLDRHETAAYVAHRLTVAGGSRELFAVAALDVIHARTGGVPRLVNQLCDLALVYAFAEGQRVIDEAVVQTVLNDRDAVGALPLFVGPDGGSDRSGTGAGAGVT